MLPQPITADESQRNAAARTFIADSPKTMLIAGERVAAASGETFDVVDPSTGKFLSAVPQGSAADVDRAVHAATRAYEASSWSKMSPHERGKLLYKLGDVLEQNAEELATIQSYDMGLLYPFSVGMTMAMADVFRYYAGWPTKILGSTFPANGPGMTLTRREPLGVVGAIIPWNGPILAAAWKIAPALACGNTIVFKPAEQAPLVPMRLAELFQEAGLPEGVLNIVTGDGSVGAAMVAHPGIAKISFTGSTETGMRIIAEGAKTLKKVTVELGGKSPTIIFPDADLDKAVGAAVMGFTSGAGQGCVCGTRVLIHEDIYEDVAKGIAAAAAGMKVGGAFDPSTQVTPIISKEQLDRIAGYIALGQEEGGQLAAGGGSSGNAGFYVEPTVFTGVRNDMRIMQEEIFGPVGGLVPFRDIDDALKIANDVSYGLSASVWTKDLATANRVTEEAKAGIVWVNTLFELDVMAPFGGYKASGIGRELGPDSIDAFTQTKTVVTRY